MLPGTKKLPWPLPRAPGFQCWRSCHAGVMNKARGILHLPCSPASPRRLVPLPWGQAGAAAVPGAGGHRLHPRRELSPPGPPFAEEAAPAGQRGPRAAPCHLPARAPLSWAGRTPLSHADPDSAAHIWGCSQHSTNSLRSFSLTPPFSGNHAGFLCTQECAQQAPNHSDGYRTATATRILVLATGRPGWHTGHCVGTTTLADSSATATC